MAKLNIAERRLPQDGRIKIKLLGREVDLRVSTLPTLYGESVVMRLLDRSAGDFYDLRRLGFDEHMLARMEHFTSLPHGIFLVTGPTGSGKSTTLAALVQTINLSDARHIVTIESPIEFTFRPRQAFIRQREVGRDTPSFEQALLDSLREDPDVLMVGEMREPETMRLTLSAAETGHLVLATVHSSNCAEALQRVVNAFPPEIQSNVAAQLADCLIAVVSQRLQFRPNLNICVPECEILKSSMSVKNFIRNRDFFKIVSSLETGAESGMWTFARYRTWLEKRTQFHILSREAEAEEEAVAPPKLPPIAAAPKTSHPGRHPVPRPAAGAKPAESGRIEIEPVESFERILKGPS
jgi:twitching motility protein PilT